MAMISVEPIGGEDRDRLRNVMLGRSRFEAFAVPDQGRTLYIWVMDDEGYRRVLEQIPAPTPTLTPAPVDEPTPPTPPAPPVAPVRQGLAGNKPVSRPIQKRRLPE